MRAALWLLSLFALAVAGAWLAGHNHGSVALFFPPYRVDLSLNLLLLVFVLVVMVVVLAQQALSALLSLPQQAQRWRLQQKERAAHAALLEAISSFLAGRFLRARKAAQTALEKEAHLNGVGLQLDHAVSLRTLAHIMVAESAHALQDRELRQSHWQKALDAAKTAAFTERQSLTEGAQLRAARWLLDDRDAAGSLGVLKSLPTGIGRRVVAMRMQLKAARLAGQTTQALDTAVLLAKHRAFTPETADSLVRGLILEGLSQIRHVDALERWWLGLSPVQRAMPELAAEAVLRWAALGGTGNTIMPWLQPLWVPLQSTPQTWGQDQLAKMVLAMEVSLKDTHTPEARQWLARIEVAQQAQPQDARWQYLAGMMCMRHQLWGKAQTLLANAVKGLQHPVLKRRAWCALAELAEQRQEPLAAAQAWKQAALIA